MRKLFGRYFLYFAGANLVNFLLFYISSYVLMNNYVEYVRYFIGETIAFAIPVVASATVSAAMAQYGFKALWIAPFISLGKIAYAYPYYYLYFIDNGLLTDESLAIAIPCALASVIIDCLVICLLSFIIYIVTAFTAKRRDRSFGECVSSAVSPFDFSEEFTLGVFISGGLVFAVNLISEIADTVEYMISYSGTYQSGEVIYIVISFIMLLAEFLFSQFVAIKLSKNSNKFFNEEKNAKL